MSRMVPDEAGVWCTPEFMLKTGKPSETILEVAQQMPADLLVMGVRRADDRMGAATHEPWATAHRVVCQASCPVLTVRD